jgi:hypothetical protein
LTSFWGWSAGGWGKNFDWMVPQNKITKNVNAIAIKALLSIIGFSDLPS